MVDDVGTLRLDRMAQHRFVCDERDAANHPPKWDWHRQQTHNDNESGLSHKVDPTHIVHEEHYEHHEYEQHDIDFP